MMKFFGKWFGKTKMVDDFIHEKMYPVNEFRTFSNDDRMRILMRLGDRKDIDINSYPIFHFAILSDPNNNVKFAALKRVHLFKNHPDLLPFMQELKKENHDDWEPYFSMALSGLGLISPEDFQRKINKS